MSESGGCLVNVEAEAQAGATEARRGADLLRAALLDSRQRWQDLVSLASDLAIETDAEGRILYLS